MYITTCTHILMHVCVNYLHMCIIFTPIHCTHIIHSWYWGDIPRAEAEKWLLTNNNSSGTFLVRMSSSQKDSLSLSVRDGESVKHYRIRRFDNGSYYVASRATFSTLNVSVFNITPLTVLIDMSCSMYSTVLSLSIVWAKIFLCFMLYFLSFSFYVLTQ